MRSAGSAWRPPGKRVLSTAISGVKGARVNPGVARASRIQPAQSIRSVMRPLASSSATSHTEITETHSLACALALRTAASPPAENFPEIPPSSQSQQCVSRSSGSSFIGFPTLPGGEDIAVDLDRSLHPPEDLIGLDLGRDQARHRLAALRDDVFAAAFLDFVQKRQAFGFEFACRYSLVHNHGQFTMVK